MHLDEIKQRKRRAARLGGSPFALHFHLLLNKIADQFIQLADGFLGTLCDLAGGALDLPLILGDHHGARHPEGCACRHAQQDARKAALRKKHAPLNYSVPLPDAEESTDTRPGPEEIAISGEQYADTMRRMQTELSVLERRVIMAGLEGKTPAQTAQELGLPAKNVANALARARRKLRGA